MIIVYYKGLCNIYCREPVKGSQSQCKGTVTVNSQSIISVKSHQCALNLIKLPTEALNTHIHDVLRTILTKLGQHHMALGLHAFCKSGSQLAFDKNVWLQNIICL